MADRVVGYTTHLVNDPTIISTETPAMTLTGSKHPTPKYKRPRSHSPLRDQRIRQDMLPKPLRVEQVVLPASSARRARLAILLRFGGTDRRGVWAGKGLRSGFGHDDASGGWTGRWNGAGSSR
jgi:hypothetical protein